MSKIILKRFNNLIRGFMSMEIALHGPMESKELVSRTKVAFPMASSKQIAGNLSAECCYFKNLNYANGVVS